MEYCGKANPEEIRNVKERDEAYVWVNNDQCPDKRSEGKEDINGCKEIISETKLDWGERQVENEIEDKRKCNDLWQFPGQDLVEHIPKGHENND